jgi:ABC-type transport system substrate-binding protein
MKSRRSAAPLKTYTWLLALALLAACGQPSTPIVQAPTALPATNTPIPVPTNTPAPTPLPGSQVYPITSLDNKIPWLPLEKGREPMTVFYGFNFNKPPFDNLLVRQAFAAAVDKDAVAEEAAGFGFREVRPAMTLTPPSVLGRDLYDEMGVLYDPVQAKALLEEAGYTDVKAFPVPTLIVYLRGAAPGAHFRIAETIVDMWEQHLGIAVKIDVQETPGAAFAKLESSNAEMFLLAWGADLNDPDNFLKQMFHSQSPENHGHFYSPEFDRYVDQAAGLSDAGERQILYIMADRVISERDVALIPLFHTLWYQQLH